MMRIFVAALPVALLFSSAGTAGQGHCVVQQYRLPARISEDMRPYLVCGLIRDRGDTETRVNGVGVSLHGQGECEEVRARAFQEADWRLASTMRDPKVRQSFLEAEFRKADEFIRSASHSDDLGLGEEPNAPKCRSTTTATEATSNGAHQ